MKSIVLNVNGQSVKIEVEPEKPLLWVLREDLGLTGTKYGCGMAICGCCVVHIDGDAIRSCVTPCQELKESELSIHPCFLDWMTEIIRQPSTALSSHRKLTARQFSVWTLPCRDWSMRQ